MIYLPDVDLWVALTSDRHVHHSVAKDWLEGIGDREAAFCRITELGFLRLLTNSRIMAEDVLSPGEAWHVYDEWRTDSRVIFLPEHADFNNHWRRIGEQISGGPNVWTDAYLAAFATHTNGTVVTFDRRFPALGNVVIATLPQLPPRN